MWNIEPDKTLNYNWGELRENIKEYGLRNSQLLALMPTASTSQIMGNNEAFEAITSNLYKRKTLAGEFILYTENILIILGFIPFFSMLNFKNLVLILVNEKSELLNKAIWISALFMIIFSIIGSFFYKGYGLAYALIFSELICFFIHSYLLKKEIL